MTGTQRKRRGVLLSGGIDATYNYPRYANDLGLAYKVLKECCGYTEDDIDVLYSYGRTITYDGLTIKARIAQKENLLRLLEHCQQELKENDEFVLVVSNHGDDKYNGLINLWGNEIILLEELAQWLKGIKAAKLIILGECYSGNFICNNIENSCIITGNEAGKYTYAHPDNWEYDEFIYNFFSYILGKYPDTMQVIKGSRVDVEEAFRFAVAHDAFNPNNENYVSKYNDSSNQYTEIPQMNNNISGCFKFE